MAQVLTTGPVENASSNPSVSLFVKVLNNSDLQPVEAEITVYSLNGAKTPLASAVRQVPPLSSDYEIFDITNIFQFEVQVSLNQDESVFVSIWGKDANADLVSAHRFVPAELSRLSGMPLAGRKKKGARSAVRPPRR